MTTLRELIPGALRSYTGVAKVQAQGSTLDAMFGDLSARYPRFRFVDSRGCCAPTCGCSSTARACATCASG